MLIKLTLTVLFMSVKVKGHQSLRYDHSFPELVFLPTSTKNHIRKSVVLVSSAKPGLLHTTFINLDMFIPVVCTSQSCLICTYVSWLMKLVVECVVSFLNTCFLYRIFDG